VYPHPIHAQPTTQHLKIKLLCTPGETSDPKFEGYDGVEMKVEWKTSAGCPREKNGDDKNKDEDKNPPSSSPEIETSGSGLGWFFLM
jgi:autophagy-related protein 27